MLSVAPHNAYACAHGAYEGYSAHNANCNYDHNE